LEDLRADGEYENRSSRNRMGRPGLDLSGSDQGQVAGAYECSNELLGSSNCRELD